MIAEAHSSSNTVPAVFDGVEITSDKLTGRSGLALFSRYVRNVKIFPHLDRLFGSMRKISKELPVTALFHQFFCFLQDGTSRWIAPLGILSASMNWRGLPRRFGNWHTIYTRMNRWTKAGVLDCVFTALQGQQIIQIKIEALSLDSIIVRVHPDGTGALKKKVRRPPGNLGEVGPPRFTTKIHTKIHMVAADARNAITFTSRSSSKPSDSVNTP